MNLRRFLRPELIAFALILTVAACATTQDGEPSAGPDAGLAVACGILLGVLIIVLI